MSTEPTDIVPVPPVDLATPRVRPAPRSTFALIPRSYAEVQLLAEWAHRAQLPTAKSPEMAAMVILAAMEMGFSPNRALLNWAVIGGKPCPRADDYVGIARSRTDLCEYFREVSTDDTQSTWTTKRWDDDKPVTLTFTMAQAVTAGFTKNAIWKALPQQMLKKRCSAFLARDVYQEIFAGTNADDEMRDVEAMQSRPMRVEPSAPRPLVVPVLEATLEPPLVSPDAELLATIADVGLASCGKTLDEQSVALKRFVASAANLGLEKASARRMALIKAHKAATLRLEELDERVSIQAADDVTQVAK